MKTIPRKLSEDEIALLRKKYAPLKFQIDFDLVYEQQVPNTGVVLLEGKLALLKRKKVVETLEPGTILGIKHLINNIPMRNGCKVIAPSELILLNKTEILEALKKKDPDLCPILRDDL